MSMIRDTQAGNRHRFVIPARQMDKSLWWLRKQRIVKSSFSLKIISHTKGAWAIHGTLIFNSRSRICDDVVIESEEEAA